MTPKRWPVCYSIDFWQAWPVFYICDKNHNWIQMTRYMFAINRVLTNGKEEPTRYGRIENSKNTKLLIESGVHGGSKWTLVLSVLVLSRLVRRLVPGEVGRPMDVRCSILELIAHGVTEMYLCSKGKASVRCSKTFRNSSSLFQNMERPVMESNFRNRLITFYKDIN